MVGPKQFIDLLFSILQEMGINEIHVTEITEIIKILYSPEYRQTFTIYFRYAYS